MENTECVSIIYLIWFLSVETIELYYVSFLNNKLLVSYGHLRFIKYYSFLKLIAALYILCLRG